MIAWTQRHPRIRTTIAVTTGLALALSVFFYARGMSLVYIGMSYAAACRGDLRDKVAWSDRASGFTPAIGPYLDAAADHVPPDAARELALAKCGFDAAASRAHLQRALTLAPTNSYVLLQAAFASLPVSPRVALAIVRRDPSDFVALLVGRYVTFRAGADVFSNSDLTAGWMRYDLAVNRPNAQTDLLNGLAIVSKEPESAIERRHGSKQREFAAYRVAAREIVASAPAHLDPRILAFAERGALPPLSSRHAQPVQ